MYLLLLNRQEQVGMYRKSGPVFIERFWGWLGKQGIGLGG